VDLPILYYYTHLSGLARAFSVGDTIQKGDILGYASARGSSGGWHHLHFSLIHLEKKIHINPFPFLKEWYNESMQHYDDYLTRFEVFQPQVGESNKNEFEKQVAAGTVSADHLFTASAPGVIQVREAVAACPLAGLNHVSFNQFALLKSRFSTHEKKGEIWFGHTGVARLYLNGKMIYSGSNNHPYHRSVQPFQWDAIMIGVEYNQGENELLVAVEQSNPFWSFSLRPRNQLGGKLTSPKE